MLASRLLGQDSPDVARVSSFAGNRVFSATAAGRTLYFKFGPPGDIAREVAVLAEVARRAVPVPTVVAADVDGRSAARFVALEQAAGGPLDGRDARLSLAGPLLRRVHAVNISGFGEIETNGPTLTAAHTTWSDALRHHVLSVEPAVESGLVPRTLVERLAAHVDAAAQHLDRETPQLLHGDFHPRHVYAKANAITAIIDWGDAKAGDPYYDLARLLHAGLTARDLDAGLALTSRVMATYDPNRALDKELARQLLLYAGVFIAWSMHGEFDGGAPWPPWWPVQVAALERVLSELDR